MMISVRLPRNDRAFELVEPNADQEPDNRNNKQSDIHLLDGKRAPGAPDEIAQSAFCSHHLGYRDQHEPNADAEPEAGS